MKQVIRWQAEDGSEWSSMDAASIRDQMIAEVAAIMEPLGEPERRHGQHTQRTRHVVEAVRLGLYRVANREGILKWWIDQQKKDHGQTDEKLMQCHPSWFCRFLDGNHRPLEVAYGRLCCIDNQYREWDQPYFANKANERAQT